MYATRIISRTFFPVLLIPEVSRDFCLPSASYVVFIILLLTLSYSQANTVNYAGKTLLPSTFTLLLMMEVFMRGKVMIGMMLS